MKEYYTDLYVSNGRAKYRQVRRLLVIWSSGQLSFEKLKTLFEVRSAVLFELVVDFSCAGTRGTATAAAAAAAHRRRGGDLGGPGEQWKL